MPSVALVGPELYPIPPIRGGAAELFIDKAAARLKGWRPLVIGVSDPKLPAREVRQGVEYFRIPLQGWRKWLYCRDRRHFPLYDRQVVSLLALLQPDLVHVHNRPLLAWQLKRRLAPGIPVILHMHNLSDSLGKREKPRPGEAIPLEGFIACSRFVLERESVGLGAGAPIRRVVYNGVEVPAFACRWEDEEAVRRARQAYGLSGEPAVLFAGKLRESKGVQVLLAAMGRVWQNLPQAALVLAGGTEYGEGRSMRQTPFLKELHRQIAQAAGRVVLTGFLPHPEMPRAYLLGDVFVGPSQVEEGLGLVFLEAAAAGLPIIATARGGIPEVVQDGVNGMLLKQQNDPGELAAKILELLRDRELGQRLGRQGRERVSENFSWEQTAHRLEQVYAEVRGLGSGAGG